MEQISDSPAITPSRPAVIVVPISLPLIVLSSNRGPAAHLGTGQPCMGENPIVRSSRCTHSFSCRLLRSTVRITPEPHERLRVILNCPGSVLGGPQSCMNVSRE